jgi:hypothetical protein
MNAASLWPGESVFNVRTVDQQIERVHGPGTHVCVALIDIRSARGRAVR